MNGTVPSWLAEWLGVPAASDAQAATWQLESAWPLPPWATVLLIAAAISCIILLYAREASGAGRGYRALLVALRLIAGSILLVMLAQWALALRLTGPPPLTLVIDRSASMGIANRYLDCELPEQFKEKLVAAGLSEPTRLNLAKLVLSQDAGRMLRELAERYRVTVYFAAGDVERLPSSLSVEELIDSVRELSADGSDSHATRLGDAVRVVLDESHGIPAAAVILLTDGVNTDGVPLGAAAEDARTAGVPLFAVGLGSARPPRDIELADVLVDDVVFVGDVLGFQLQVKASGLEGEPAKVILRRENEAAPLAEDTIVLPPNGRSLSARLMDRPREAGEIAYAVEVAARDDEQDQQNNVQRRAVRVLDQKIRVLLAFGYPNYEFRFLKSLLERDRTIELATYLQDADLDYAEQDKTALRNFPVGRDELFEYDVLVIGDIDPRRLPRSVWPHVRSFVSENGGGTALLAGPRFLPWLFRDIPDVAALLPVEPGSIPISSTGQLPSEANRPFVVRPTPLGLQSPALQLGDFPATTQQIWSDLSPLYWLAESGELKPAAQVFAEGAGEPVIVFQYVGAGRVLFHAIDSTWRWRLGAGDSFFTRYWVQTIRFLARGKLAGGRGVQLTTDRREYRRGESVELRARFLDPQLVPGEEAVLAVESAGQPRRRIALGRNPAAQNVFEAMLADLPAGQYEVLLAQPQLAESPPAARFSVVAPPGEMARTEMDVATLKSAAERTRGRFYTITEADRLLAELPPGRRVPVENLPPVSLWNRWWMIAAFIVAITTEWILRKRKGML